MFGNSDLTSRLNVVQGDVSGLRALERAEAEFDALRSEAIAAAKAAETLDKKLGKVAGSKVNVGAASGGIERLVNALDGGLGGALLGIAGDAMDVADALSDQGLGGAIAALATPAGIAVAAAGGLALGISKLTEEYQRQEQVAKEHIQTLVEAAERQVEFNQLLRDGGVEAVEAQDQALSDLRARAQAGRDRAQAEVDRLTALVNEQNGASIGISEELEQNILALRAAEVVLADAEKKLADIAPGLTAFDRAVLSVTEAVDTATERAGNQGAGAFELLKLGADNFIEAAGAANDAITAVFDKAKENLTAAENDRFTKRLASSMKEQADQTASLTASLGEMGARLKESREAAKELGEAAIEAFTELQTEVQSAVDKLDADGTKLGDKLRSSIADLNRQAVDAQIDAAAEIADAQIEAARNRLEAESQFNKESNRAYEDFRAEQRRIREDADRAEKSAIESNDILALLDINEQATVEKQRNRDRFETERQRRAEDFADRQAAEAAALELTIAGINQRRDEELANIAAEIAAERVAFDEAFALIELQKAAQIAQIDAVAAANETRYAAEEAAIDRIATKMQALVVYQNGKLISLNPGLLNSPQTAGNLLGVPPPPTDPFGLGQFFGGSSLPPPRDPGLLFAPERAASVPPTQIVLNEGSVVVGDLASREDIFSAFRTLAAVLFQARTGVAA